ncbi:hypothetical protein GGR58DRAFT_514909 [Xylaria digitata]|nr:hypothetical protein GGR58DRAFT_514909 [Xylaria digitata]
MASQGGGVLDLFDTLNLGTRPPGHQIEQQAHTAEQPGAPMSPWGNRYGLLSINPILRSGTTHHSGFMPEQPRLDPKFYCEAIPRSELDACGHFHHPNAIARYFWIEHVYIHILRGFRPWQLAPLNQYVVFSPRGLLPGGHWRAEPFTPHKEPILEKLAPYALANNIPVVSEDIIQVNEGSWFSFFHPERWYDSFPITKERDGTMLSIDRPDIWNPLRTSIELVNRNIIGVLNALINDRNPAFHTLLFGVLGFWKDVIPLSPCPPPFDNARVLLSYDKYKSWCDMNNQPCHLDYSLQFTPEAWRQELQKLLQNQTWGLCDSSIFSGLSSPTFSIIILGTNEIESLSSGDTTLAEQCHLTYYLARTIFHELMHAIMSNRLKNNFNLIDSTGQLRYGREPFVDFDAVAEMGYAMEQRVFGGVIRNIHGKYSLGSYHCSWPYLDGTQLNGPSVYGYKIGDHPIFHQQGEGSKSVLSPLPALYSAKMLSRHFWEDPTIPRKSDNFFYRTVLLSSSTTYHPGRPTIYGDIVIDNEKLSSLPGDALGIGDIEMKKWAEVQIMTTAFDFSIYFNSAEEIRCGNISEFLYGLVQWSQDKEIYKENLKKAPYRWMFHILVAALPIRQRPISKASAGGSRTLELLPSKRAPRLPPLHYPLKLGEELRCGQSTLCGNPWAGIEHDHYLEQVQYVLELLGEAEMTLPKPWLFEIMRLFNSVVDQRREVKKQYPSNHLARSILNWDFKLPDYDPISMVTWHDAKKEWEARMH